MAESAVDTKQSQKVVPSSKSSSSRVEYLLGKGTSRLLNARIRKHEIHLLVNGPAMLYDSARLLTSLDMINGATFHAWKHLAAALTCTSYCGFNGKTNIPIEVETSRIGTCLRFSMGPMSMYQTLIVIRPKKKGQTIWDVLDEAFNHPSIAYTVTIVPEAASGHLEHDASIFEPAADSTSQHNHDHQH